MLLHNAFRDIMDDLRFGVVYLMLPNVFGPDRLCKNRAEFNKGTNSILMNHLLGRSRKSLLNSSIHIDDVATCHVDALSQCIPTGRYLLNGRGRTNWFDAISIVKKYHPEAVGSVFATENTLMRVTPCVIKNNLRKRKFWLRFKTFDEQVKDTVDFYLSLPPGKNDEVTLDKDADDGYEKAMTEGTFKRLFESVMLQ